MTEDAARAVLIVGVRQSLARTLSGLIESGGRRAVVVGDGEEAIAEARRQSFDVLLAGESLRWMTPLELARRIREISPKVVCILLSQAEESGGTTQADASAAGYAEVLRTPIDPAEVARCVGSLAEGPGTRTREETAVAPANTPQNTRRHPRVPLRTTVRYQSDDSVHVDSTRNLSLGGIFIETERVLSQGTPLTLKLALPGQEGSVLVPARVVRVQGPTLLGDQTPGVGVEFLVLDREAREALGACVRALGESEIPAAGEPREPQEPPRAPSPPPPPQPKAVQPEARLDIAFPSAETFLDEYSRSVSFNGMFVRAPADKLLPPGTILEVRIDLPDRERPLLVQGEVVAVEKGETKGKPSGMAIQFLPDCAEDVRALHAFARSHRAPRRPGT